MSAFPGAFVEASALAAGAGPDASVALIATDLAAGGWLLVGLAATAVVGLFLCRDRRSPSRRAWHLTSRPWFGAGRIASRPQRRLAHP